MHPQKLTGTDDWAVKTSRESIWWKWLWTVLLSQEKKKKSPRLAECWRSGARGCGMSTRSGDGSLNSVLGRRPQVW